MKNFDEYVHFVVGAKISGCEVEHMDGSLIKKPAWCWNGACAYRIKLPEGWEYVIEDGEIAFREAFKGEWILKQDYTVGQAFNDLVIKRPIIKKIEE